MRILMVAPEVSPFAKTGGLADVVGALPLALARLGHEVDIVMPKYAGLDDLERAGSVPVVIGTVRREASLLTTDLASGVQVIAVEQEAYYARDHLYGSLAGDYADNAERFAFLAHATLAVVALTSPGTGTR